MLMLVSRSRPSRCLPLGAGAHATTGKLPEQFPDLTTGCEDIAMAYLYAHHTRTPPLWVAGATFHDIGHSKLDGISTQTGHNEARQACVHHFSEVFGRDTLVDTQLYATLYKDGETEDWV